MYSIVLMTALTAGPAAPDFCHGRWSCHNACYGGCAGGCWGCSGCSGCCSGCWGGCCSGYGYMNIDGVNLCHGSWGGYGAYYGGGYYGYGCSCFGCYGRTPNFYAPFGCHGCYGAYSGWSCYGASSSTFWGPVDLGPPDPKAKGKIEETTPPPVKEKKLPDGKLPEETRLNNRARVVIDVPADAKLYIDGHLMKTTSARRIFQTPDLVAGQTYFYDLKVEVVREGKTLSETQRVLLRPGYSATASFATMDRAETATARRE